MDTNEWIVEMNGREVAGRRGLLLKMLAWAAVGGILCGLTLLVETVSAGFGGLVTILLTALSIAAWISYLCGAILVLVRILRTPAGERRTLLRFGRWLVVSWEKRA